MTFSFLQSKAECAELVRRILAICAPAPSSALSLLRGGLGSSAMNSSGADVPSDSIRTRLPTGMLLLDKCLRGGFRVGITELIGRAGVGKSQLAMQLCVIAAKYEMGSIYIDTEKKMSIRRLREVANARAKAFDTSCAGVDSAESFQYQNTATSNIEEMDEMQDGRYKDPSVVLENIIIHSPGSTKEMLSVVCERLEEEILMRNDDASSQPKTCEVTKFPVGLIILDSIAAPARRDFGVETAPQRVAALFQTAQMLKRIADQLQIAVVVINQVGMIGENLLSHHMTNQCPAGSDFVSVQAALGSSWHHCVSTR
mmetsp:Transcript_50408/g.151830  ORF Transcript_50408/g.151830 Transcript_50408/m.151830 type:complete len:313 (-) Transcript_50408:2535-3473(-)